MNHSDGTRPIPGPKPFSSTHKADNHNYQLNCPQYYKDFPSLTESAHIKTIARANSTMAHNTTLYPNPRVITKYAPVGHRPQPHLDTGVQEDHNNPSPPSIPHLPQGRHGRRLSVHQRSCLPGKC